MLTFQLVLALLLGGVGLALLAPRLGVPWPALLAVAGAGLAFVPGVPEVRLDPGLALALFVAPVLLDAAYDTSLRDLGDNWVPVGGLVVVAVTLTVGAVAAAAHWIEPSLGWAAAVALGAIVAPPDAAAATSVLRQVKMPHRLAVILEGESLLNDASALLAYKAAVAAAMGAALGGWSGLALVGEAAGGLLAGHVLARGYFAVAGHVKDEAPAVVLQFLGTFGVWVFADAVGLSAVLTLVAYAVTIARWAPERTSGRRRRASYAVWEVAVFVLNVLAFILVGLQLRGLLARLEDAWRAAALAGLVLAVVILVRIVWVMAFHAALRAKLRWWGTSHTRPLLRPTVAGAAAIAWCGMRGIVTLAAALALPERFPQRDLVVFTAFCVVLGTLVLQGMTLRPLLSWLPLPEDDTVERELTQARQAAARAALEALGEDRGSEAGRLLEQEYQARLHDESGRIHDATGITGLRRRMVSAERACVAALRQQGHIGDHAFHALEEQMDWVDAELEVVEQE